MKLPRPPVSRELRGTIFVMQYPYSTFCYSYKEKRYCILCGFTASFRPVQVLTRYDALSYMPRCGIYEVKINKRIPNASVYIKPHVFAGAKLAGNYIVRRLRMRAATLKLPYIRLGEGFDVWDFVAAETSSFAFYTSFHDAIEMLRIANAARDDYSVTYVTLTGRGSWLMF